VRKTLVIALLNLLTSEQFFEFAVESVGSAA
jgi:hypothetical protein